MTDRESEIKPQASAAERLKNMYMRKLELEQLAKSGMLKGRPEAEKEYLQLKADIEAATLRLVAGAPLEKVSQSAPSQKAEKISSAELEQLKKRRAELEYMAHAHAVEGQELPPVIEQEYAILQTSISRIEADLSQKK